MFQATRKYQDRQFGLRETIPSTQLYPTLLSILKDSIQVHFEEKLKTLNKNKNPDHHKDIKLMIECIKGIEKLTQKTRTLYNNLLLKSFNGMKVYVKVNKTLADAINLDVDKIYSKGDIEKAMKEVLGNNGNIETKKSKDNSSDNTSNSNIMLYIYNSKKGEKFNKYAYLLPTNDIFESIDRTLDEKQVKGLEKKASDQVSKWSKEAKDGKAIYSINIINTIKHHLIEITYEEQLIQNSTENKKVIDLLEKLNMTPEDWVSYMKSHQKKSKKTKEI